VAGEALKYAEARAEVELKIGMILRVYFLNPISYKLSNFH